MPFPPAGKPHCPKCLTDVSPSSHACICGAISEYICSACQDTVYYAAGRELRHNPCGAKMTELAEPRTEPAPVLQEAIDAPKPTHDNQCTCEYRIHPGAKSSGLHHAPNCPMRTEGGMPLADIADLFVRSLPVRPRSVGVCKCGHTDSAHVRRNGKPGCGVHGSGGELCRCSGFSLR